MVVTTPPAQTGLDGAASVNSVGNQVSVIVGGSSGNNTVTINGLNALSAFGSSATATLEYVPSHGRTTPVSGTTVLSTTTYTITNGSITVPINSMDSAGAYHLLVTPAGTTSTTPTPGTTPTATSTSTSGGSCKVAYTITNQWQGGFGANIAITNTGTTAWSSWTLTFSFANGQTITQLWNGSVSQAGSNVTVTNASFNGTVAAGATTSPGPGFNGTWNGTNAAPTSFKVNGATCS
jgi:hypothetical protein